MGLNRFSFFFFFFSTCGGGTGGRANEFAPMPGVVEAIGVNLPGTQAPGIAGRRGGPGGKGGPGGPGGRGGCAGGALVLGVVLPHLKFNHELTRPIGCNKSVF